MPKHHTAFVLCGSESDAGIDPEAPLVRLWDLDAEGQIRDTGINAQIWRLPPRELESLHGVKLGTAFGRLYFARLISGYYFIKTEQS